MSKLLIFIGENIKFDKEEVVKTISSLDGALNPREGKFIGAIFECEVKRSNYRTIVRLAEDLETITVEGTDDDSLKLALSINERLSVSTSLVDMDYSFHVDLSSVSNIEELKEKVLKGI